MGLGEPAPPDRHGDPGRDRPSELGRDRHSLAGSKRLVEGQVDEDLSGASGLGLPQVDAHRGADDPAVALQGEAAAVVGDRELPRFQPVLTESLVVAEVGQRPGHGGRQVGQIGHVLEVEGKVDPEVRVALDAGGVDLGSCQALEHLRLQQRGQAVGASPKPEPDLGHHLLGLDLGDDEGAVADGQVAVVGHADLSRGAADGRALPGDGAGDATAAQRRGVGRDAERGVRDRELDVHCVVGHRLAAGGGGQFPGTHINHDVDGIDLTIAKVVDEVVAGRRGDMLRPEPKGGACLGGAGRDVEGEAAVVGGRSDASGDPAAAAAGFHREFVDDDAAGTADQHGVELIDRYRLVTGRGSAQHRIASGQGQRPLGLGAGRTGSPGARKAHRVTGAAKVDLVDAQRPRRLVPVRDGAQALDGDRIEVLLLDEEVAVAGAQLGRHALDAAVIEGDVGLGGKLEVSGHGQPRLAGQQEKVGDGQVVEGDGSGASQAAGLVQVAAESPFPVRTVDAKLEDARVAGGIAPEQRVDAVEHRPFAGVVVDQGQAAIGDARPVEGADHAGRIEHDAEDRGDGRRERRDVAARGVDARQGMRLRLAGMARGSGGECDRPVAMDERGHLQVAEFDEARLDRQPQQAPGIEADHGHRRAHHQRSLRVADVEPADLEREGALAIELEGAVAQVDPPARPDPRGDRGGHLFRQPLDAQRARGQAQDAAAHREHDQDQREGAPSQRPEACGPARLARARGGFLNHQSLSRWIGGPARDIDLPAALRSFLVTPPGFCADRDVSPPCHTINRPKGRHDVPRYR